MKSVLYSSAVSALSVLLIAVLLIGCGAACAQPLIAKSQHSCCDPKGSCKSNPAQMKSGTCERDAASLPEVAGLAVDLTKTSPIIHETSCILSNFDDNFAPIASIERLTPLRI